MEQIDAFDAAKKKVVKAKTEKAKADAQKDVEALKETIKALYVKALNYLKDEAHVVDLQDECGYQPWSDDVTKRVENWINKVLNMQDPKTETVNEAAPAEVALNDAATASADPVDDLPF